MRQTECRRGHGTENYRRLPYGAICVVCRPEYTGLGHRTGSHKLAGRRYAMTDRNDAIVAAIQGGEVMAEVARRLGVTRERVRQVYTRATGKGIGHKRPGHPKTCSTCAMTYGDWHAHVRTAAHIEARFWRYVAKGPYCWNWTGAVAGGKGPGTPQYGHFALSATESRFSHRLAYEWLVGAIPEGLAIDHLCRNTQCVNPAHLEAVTHKENVRRGKNVALVHLHKRNQRVAA